MNELGFLLKTIIDRSMTWTSIKREFRVESDKIVYATWDDDEGWTEIHLEKEW